MSVTLGQTFGLNPLLKYETHQNKQTTAQPGNDLLSLEMIMKFLEDQEAAWVSGLWHFHFCAEELVKFPLLRLCCLEQRPFEALKPWAARTYTRWKNAALTYFKICFQSPTKSRFTGRPHCSWNAKLTSNNLTRTHSPNEKQTLIWDC